MGQETPRSPEARFDARENAIVVTGAVMMALGGMGAEVVRDQTGDPQPALYIWPGFMKSRYRVDITMDPEDEPDA